MTRTAMLRDSVAASLEQRSQAIRAEASALDQIKQSLADLPSQIEQASSASAEAIAQSLEPLTTSLAVLSQIRQSLAALPTQIEQASSASAEAMAGALEPLATSLAALSQETTDALSAARSALREAQTQAATQAQQQAQALKDATSALTGLQSTAQVARDAQATALKEASTSLTDASLALTKTGTTLLEGQRQAHFAASDSLRRILIGASVLATLAIGSPWATAWWTGSLISPRQQSQRADEQAWGRAVATVWQQLPAQAQVLLQRAREQTAQQQP